MLNVMTYCPRKLAGFIKKKRKNLSQKKTIYNKQLGAGAKWSHHSSQPHISLRHIT